MNKTSTTVPTPYPNVPKNLKLKAFSNVFILPPLKQLYYLIRFTLFTALVSLPGLAFSFVFTVNLDLELYPGFVGLINTFFIGFSLALALVFNLMTLYLMVNKDRYDLTKDALEKTSAAIRTFLYNKTIKPYKNELQNLIENTK